MGNLALSLIMITLFCGLILICSIRAIISLIKVWQYNRLNLRINGRINHKSASPIYRNRSSSLYDSVSISEETNLVQLPIDEKRNNDQG